MANNCFVDIDITTASEEDAERLHKILTAAKKDAAPAPGILQARTLEWVAIVFSATPGSNTQL